MSEIAISWEEAAKPLTRYVDACVSLAAHDFAMALKPAQQEAMTNGGLSGSGWKHAQESVLLDELARHAAAFQAEAVALLDRSGKRFPPAEVAAFSRAQLQRFADALWADREPFGKGVMERTAALIERAAAAVENRAMAARLAGVELPQQVLDAFAALEQAVRDSATLNEAQRQVAIETVQQARSDAEAGALDKMTARLDQFSGTVGSGEKFAGAVQTLVRWGEAIGNGLAGLASS